MNYDYFLLEHLSKNLKSVYLSSLTGMFDSIDSLCPIKSVNLCVPSELTDNCKSLGDTAVLILHFCSEAKSTLSERVLHYCFHATYRGSFRVALCFPCSTRIALMLM